MLPNLPTFAKQAPSAARCSLAISAVLTLLSLFSPSLAAQSASPNEAVNVHAQGLSKVKQPVPQAATTCPALLNHTVKKLQDESPMNLCQYTGKVVLVVNTASFCGFVGQYEPLEALYKKYQARGLVVLGFPSNDFGKQEPGSAKEISDFCVNTYGVQFPMTSKTVVSGAGAHPLYKALASATKDTPSWNFHKYLIARDGKTVVSYGTLTSPSHAKVVNHIEQMLAAQ